MKAAKKAAPAKSVRKPAKSGSLASFIERASPEIEQAERDNDKQARSRQKAEKSKTAKPKPATRANKKGLILYVDAKVTRALRRLALDTDRSVQELGLAGLNMLFKSYGMAEFPFVRRAGQTDGTT